MQPLQPFEQLGGLSLGWAAYNRQHWPSGLSWPGPGSLRLQLDPQRGSLRQRRRHRMLVSLLLPV